MNPAARPAVSHEPSSRDLMDRALDPHLLVGMPHLTPHGLSETWLMKELGHRHWLMLARDLGMDSADFRAAGGGGSTSKPPALSLRSTIWSVHFATLRNAVCGFAPASPTSAKTCMSHCQRLRMVLRAAPHRLDPQE